MNAHHGNINFQKDKSIYILTSGKADFSQEEGTLHDGKNIDCQEDLTILTVAKKKSPQRTRQTYRNARNTDKSITAVGECNTLHEQTPEAEK